MKACFAARGQVAERDPQLERHRHGLSAASAASGRMCGNRITSRMEGESVRIMASRSMPTPQPPVGGRPWPERAHVVLVHLVRLEVALLALLAAGRGSASRCSSGSFSSEKPLAISIPAAKSSKRSVAGGSSGARLGQRRDLDRIVDDERRVPERVLGEVLEELGHALAVRRGPRSAPAAGPRPCRCAGRRRAPAAVHASSRAGSSRSPRARARPPPRAAARDRRPSW